MANRTAIACALLLTILPLAGGQERPAVAANFQSVLDRIHQHAATGEWQRAGWKDEQIERWLDAAVGLIAKAAEHPELTLPVRWAGVKADAAGSGMLIVGKDVSRNSDSLKNSIILADGNVELQSASGCVIVARGAVTADSMQYCVVAAGALVSIATFDGSPQDTANGSVILSRGWANLGTAYGSYIFAPEGTTLNNANDATFINAAFVGGTTRSSNRTLRVRSLPIEELPAPPFSQPLRVLGLVRPDGAPEDTSRLRGLILNGTPPASPFGVVLRYGERRYFAAFGQPIVDQDGKPVEALRGWHLAFADDAVALFSSGTADAAVRLDGR